LQELKENSQLLWILGIKTKKDQKKHRIGRGDNLATIVDKGMAAAILFLLTAIFFFDRLNKR